MRSRFFTLASSLLLTFAGILTIDAQTRPSPTPPPAYIRFWDMLPVANGTFEIRRTNSGPTESVLSVATGYQYSGYAEYPTGKYRLALYRRGEDRPLKLFEVDLRPQTYFTILISPQSINLFDDTVDPAETTGRVTVRNFFPGVTIAAVSQTQKLTDSIPYGQSYVASGLPLSHFPVTLRARLPNGQSAEAGAEVDLKTWKHATVLVIPDSYGRFRARATSDGRNP